MKKTRFTDEQMVTILREADTKPVPGVAKKHGVSAQTIYSWRKHLGSLEPSDVKRLRQLERQAMATAIPQACLASSAIRCRDVETGPNLGAPGAGGECVLSVQIDSRGSAARPVPRRASGRVRGRV